LLARIGEKNFTIPYPRPPNLAYPNCVLSKEESLSGKRSLQRTERKLAGPGRPGTVDGLVAKVERREAQRLALGARGRLAARGGFAARLQGCLASTLAPPAAPPPREGIARDWQTSDASRRENAEAWTV